MFKKLKISPFAVYIVSIILFVLGSFVLNTWLSYNMQRHQIIQLPLMVLIGIILSYGFPNKVINGIHYSIAILILIMSSFIFWMIPRSIDLTILYPWFNRLMHINMIVVGFYIIITLRNLILELKIAFLLMLCAMLITSGLALHNIKILLCSSFSIEQQNITGLYLMIIGISFFIYTLIVLFKTLNYKL